jgi:uncharacterized protein YdeI (YjbR/CyaY-like superfamily)
VIETENFDTIEITSSAELRAWLLNNHGQSKSVWLVTYKKHVQVKYVSTSEILDELLCFGWIDGVRRKVDNNKTMQLISPRKTQLWARTYKTRFAKLQNEGRIHLSGLRSIEMAKQNSTWTAMEDVDALEIPLDLNEVLSAQPPTLLLFNSFAPSYRRNVLRWLKLAKTNGTREKRLVQIAQFSQENKRIPQM